MHGTNAIMGPIGFPETSVNNPHYMLRNFPENCRSLLQGKKKFQNLTAISTLLTVLVVLFTPFKQISGYLDPKTRPLKHLSI